MKMNLIYLVLTIVSISCSGNSAKTAKINESDIVVKSVLRGCFKLPQSDNSLVFIDDSTYYFLVDVKLINVSDHSIQFLTNSCTAVVNIVLDTKAVRIGVNNCSTNSMTTIELKPKEEFSLPIILQTKKRDAYSKVKIGWLFFVPKGFINTSDSEFFEKSRKSLENVIWSEPLYLHPASGRPYEIKY